MLEFVAACIVDVQNLPVNIIAAWGVPYKRILRGEVRGLQDHEMCIRDRYGTTYQKIASMNGIQDPNKIYAGQKIRVK